MKLLITALALSASFNLFAEDEAKNNKWEEKKTMALERIESKIAILTETKNCITAATTKEAFKECRKARKEKMNEHKAKFGKK